MNKTKILQLCNEIEVIMCEISNTGHTMQNCDYEAVDKRLKAIVAEITAPPKTNGDRIRAMTDEELAKFIFHVTDCCSKGWQWCEDCPLNGAGEFCEVDEFTEYFGKEVGE